MLGGDLVKELPQGLVALAPVANLVGHAGGARGDVGGPVLLAGVVEVTGLGGVQAVVPLGHGLHCRGEKGRRDPRVGGPEAHIRSVLPEARPGPGRCWEL